jgi:hypothetical protein
MSATRGQGNTLGIAIVISIVVVALVVLAAARVRLPKSVDAKSSTPALVSSVAIARADNKGGNAALLAQVELYDQKSLFSPTPDNSSDPALPATLRREPGNAFKTISPQLTFAEYEMSIVLPEPIAVPKNLVEALHTGETANPFFTFGRINYPYTPLPKRLAFVEVLQAKTGRTVLAAPLSAGPNDNLPAVDWQPLEMVVAVENSGLIGTPTVTSPSGFEEVDDYFRAFIVKQFRLGARLPPGFYMLRIGQ